MVVLCKGRALPRGTVKDHEERFEIWIRGLARLSAGHLIGVGGRIPAANVRQGGIINVMFGREAIPVDTLRDVPVRVAPITVIKGTSILRETFINVKFRSKRDR